METIYRVYGDLTLNGETGRMWFLQTKDFKYAIDKLNRLSLQGHKNLEIKTKTIDSEFERNHDDWV